MNNNYEMTKREPNDPNYLYGQWLSNPDPGEEVIISGMSGRLPESSTIQSFSDKLFNKIEMVSEDYKRWTLEHPEVPKRMANIPDINQYDAGYFGVHYRQAHFMDPQMRVFMETAIEAIMDAGVNPVELEGTRTGVFISTSWSDLELDTYANITQPQRFAITGYLRSLISKRISYHLKLKSPAFNSDTACSSSFNSLDAAFKAIRSGQCDSALVGGTNLVLHPGTTLQFFRLGVLSSDARCKVFDQNASGYVRGESIVCIFLQKAKNSRRIYAKIISTKVNGDGFKDQGITFPSTLAQIQLMTEIYKDSNIHPSELSFLEAHGTGTQVGDPQEVEAIDWALAQKRQKQLLVGSVKSSIGHTEPASGVCSLIKVLLAMETGYITPNINLQCVKQGMRGLEEGRMKVVTEITKLEGNEAIVGINNFGFGGNNSHAIIQRFGKEKINKGIPVDDIPRLVCVSGRSEAAVLKMLRNLNNKSLDYEHIALFHQIFKNNFRNHLYRGYTIISKTGPIATSSTYLASQISPLYVLFGQFVESFQVLGLYLMKFPVFRKTISRINRIALKQKMNTFEEILNNQSNSQNTYGSICVQIGIVDILKCLDLHPVAVYGDSYGKLINAYYYNVANLEETVLAALKVSTSIDPDVYFETILNKSLHKCLLKGDSFDYKHCMNLPKNAFVLNISNSLFKNKDVLLVEENNVKFLNILGRLYENGHIPQLHQLYPKTELPVSRSTPMISPLIEWDHRKSWRTYKFSNFVSSDSEQKEYNISFLFDEYKHIAGHVVDGRNFYPAAEYLYLVWHTIAYSRKLLTNELPVIFEDCKFNRAVIMPKSGFLKVLVMIQKGTGTFEIFEKNSVVVTGRIRSVESMSAYWVDLKPFIWNEKNPTQILEQDEIYRELGLRGYNYSGQFKGIERCNTEASLGFIKWKENWGTFIDSMLQMKILQTDSRLLYVPVGIKKLVIDPAKHFETVKKLETEEPVLPVHVYADCDIVCSGGIQVSGLLAKSIFKKKAKLQPVLEKHVFVPNCSTLDIAEAVRIDVQIILENSLETHFKAVEIIDDFTDSSSDYLLTFVCDALDDVPVVTPDLTISSKIPIQEIPGIKIQDTTLTPQSNVLLITATKLLQRPNFLKQVLSFLHKNGFLLTREELTTVPEVNIDIEIITEYALCKEKLILLKKREHVANTKFIPVYSNNLDWLPELQNSLKQDANVVVYSNNQQPEGILGLVNCIRREPNGNKLKCFFLMEEVPEFDPNNLFYSDQIKKNLAINIYKTNSWGSYRHLHLEKASEIECEHCYANVTNKGDISSFKWLEGPLTRETPLPKNAILISTYYTAVNFKDIMVASGRVNVEALTKDRIDQDCLIGFEFAGRELSGRRVFGMVNNRAISTYIVADSGFLWEVPDSWSLEEAATIPVVYSTVLYALLMVHELKRGSSILIHSATGGIGLAALNVCIYYDCDIYVTVGTEEKKKYLREHYPQIPTNHIGNSRDTSFENMIKTETQGRGVDVVLNSLSDDKLKASIRCVARGGRFIEIGKFDLANDTSLKLLVMEKQINFSAIMLDQVLLTSEKIKKAIVKVIYDGMKTGFVKVLPRVVFNSKEIEASYRFMMTGKHMGKVLVKLRDEEKDKYAAPAKTKFLANPRFNCDVRYCYIIIGGLGGIGLELCDWLIMRRATKLVLVSRSGIRSGYQTQRIRIWKSYGVDVRISTTDVTTKQGCIDLVNEAKKLGPVDGVFNLGVVLNDGLLEDQTKENFLTSLAPKAQITMHLDKVTRNMCPTLRYFVIFSSVSCGRGNPGQSNYGMANSIMERICEKRKGEGLPALAIQWGAIGEVGLVAKLQKENKELVIGGTLQQKISSCFDVLDTFLRQDNPIVASMVVAEKLNRNYGGDSVVETISQILGIKDIKTVSQHATLAELGMDSIMATEIIQILEKDFEIYLTAKDMRSLTFSKLIELDTERSILQKSPNDKTEQGANMLLQYIPDSRTSHLQLIKLPSAVDINEKAPTVFLFPGIEGVLHPVETLSKELRAHVHGVQYSYNNPEETVQDMAKSIASNIENYLSKTIPFFFVGYSFGASVSLDTALILEENGYLGHVIAVDGSPTYLLSSAKKFLPVENENEFETALLYNLLSILVSFESLVPHKEKFLKCENLDERISFGLTLIPAESDTKLKLERQGAVTLHKRVKAILNYKSIDKKVKSQVHLFKAKYPMTKEEEDYQLSQLCEKPVTVTTVEGDHVSILKQPELSEHLNKIITLT